MLSLLCEHLKYMCSGSGFPAAAGLWCSALNSEAARNRPLTIIMALIIHPRPPSMIQHTLWYTPFCVSVRPSWGETGLCKWEEVDNLKRHCLKPRTRWSPCSRALIRDVDTRPDNLVVGYFPVSILYLFWMITKAALGLWVFVSIWKGQRKMLFLLAFRLVPVQHILKSCLNKAWNSDRVMCEDAMALICCIFVRKVLVSDYRKAAPSQGPCWLFCDSPDQISLSHFLPNLKLISAFTLVCKNTHYVINDLDQMVLKVFPCFLSVTHHFSKEWNCSVLGLSPRIPRNCSLWRLQRGVWWSVST